MNFYFSVHPRRAQAQEICAELRALLTQKGHCITEDAHSADFAVAIGGDGTVVEAFRHCSAPILGINAGTLGYLPRVEPEKAREAVLDLLEGRFTLENRMTLTCTVSGQPAGIALNEAALLKPGVAPIRFSVSVDGIELMRYTADGMIAATPTGSTGYSLSAGGPIVEPTAEMLILTPVSPHTLVNRPVVLSAASVVTFCCESDATISLDGSPCPLKADTPFTVRASRTPMRFVCFEQESFLSRLRKKLT